MEVRCDYMNFGEKLVKLRKEKNISQEGLANYMKVSRQTISNWESDITSPNIEQVIKLAKFFNVSIDSLLNIKGKDIKTNKNDTLVNIMIFLFKFRIIFSIVIILIILIALAIYIIHYNIHKTVGIYNLQCTFEEGEYYFNIYYNKKKKMENYDINLSLDKNFEYFRDLYNELKSRNGTDAYQTIEYINGYFEKINGCCYFG